MSNEDQAGLPHPWPTEDGECAALIRDLPWHTTSLGPTANWPSSLRTTVDTLLPCSFPMVALWGPDLIQIYNDGYASIMAGKHPAGMGQPTRLCWPELWQFNQPIYQRILRGESITLQDQLFPITRHGYLENAHFTLCYSPLRDESASIIGVLVTVFETTQRLRAEAALSESETRYRAYLTASVDAVYRMSADWSEMRQLVVRNFLVDTGEPNPHWLDVYIHPHDRPRVLQAIQQAIRTRTAFELEHRVIRADGSLGYTFSRAVPILDEQGEIREWIGAASDVTDRRRAEESLRASEERQVFLLRLSDALRPLADGMEVQKTTSQLLGKHLGVDRCYYFETDRETGEYVIRSDYKRAGLRSLVGRHKIQQWPEMTAALSRGEILVVDDYANSPDIPPEERPPTENLDISAIILIPLVKQSVLVACMATIQAVPRRWKPEEVALVKEVAERTWAALKQARAEQAQLEAEQQLRRHSEQRAIVERERLQNEVKNTSEVLGQTREELRALTQRLLTEQDVQQRRIAQEIHDGIGQRVALIGMQAGILRNCQTMNSAELQDALSTMGDYVAALTREVRDVSHTLHPPVISDLGLVPALQQLVDQQKASGTSIELHLEPCPPLPIEISTALYRIVQEAIANATRHAPHSTIYVSLDCEMHGGEHLALSIRDEGPGFDVHARPVGTGLGLVSMRQRAQAVGASLTIESSPAEGTEVIVHLPLAKARQ